MKNILAILGSTRENSTNESILKYITETYSDQLNVDIFNKIDALPHFKPGLDKDQIPSSVHAFRNKIQDADGVIICTPEYVFSLPGTLKNAIEWNVSTTNFSNKPVAIIVASASGKKALKSLQLIMKTIEATISENSKLLIQGAKGKIDSDGMINDPTTSKRIDKLVNTLIKTIKTEYTIPTKYR